MRRFLSCTAFLLTIASACASANGQAVSGPPVRPLGWIVASSAADFTLIAEVRGLSDGRVLVHDSRRRLVVMFDSTLRGGRVVLDSAHGSANSYGGGSGLPAGFLFRGLGDSSLFLDPVAESFLVVDPSGVLAGTRALPSGGQRITASGTTPAAAALNAASVVAPFTKGGGLPAMSGRFGLVYGSGNQPISPRLAAPNPRDTVFITVEDSAALFAMNAQTRAVDTLAKFATLRMRRYAFAPGRTIGRGAEVPRLAETGDAWAVMTDGSIAILRGREYRISWFNADGTRSESRPLPYSWKRLSDDDKQRMLDSATRAEQEAYQAELAKGRADSAAGRPYSSAAANQGRGGTPGPITATQPLRYDIGTIPDYVSPFVPGQRRLLADADNNLWIRVGRGVDPLSETYDVVNRMGELIDRVRLPEGDQLIGFSPGGIAYLIGHDAGKQLLKRARVK
jgi:hypothetical protein